MSLVSIEFIVFVGISLILYFALPKKIRYIALLVMSYAFYCSGGFKTVGYLIFTTVSTFLTALFIEKCNKKLEEIKKLKDNKLEKKLKLKKKIYSAFAIISNFGILFFLKYGNSASDIILPLGISFYMFQSIGYVIDIYRKKYPAEKNVLKFALFVSFFPQIIQGPISRYDSLGKQINNPKNFSFDFMKSGIQLAMWGYFKKLVIADRAAIVVNQVFGNYAKFDGGIILLGVIFYCIQLYCDFSGGIDITRAVAKMFGIDLVDNFKRPIFATSLADFWRRWHISLGTWMKDYLFYPLSLSKPMVKMGKTIRKHLSGKAGKIIPVSIVTFIVYLAIGIWHGSSLKYIVFGLWNGCLITASLLLEPFWNKVKNKLKINDKSKIFNAFQIVRTSILVLIGRYITRAGRFLASLEMLKLTVTTFTLKGITDGTLLNMGLTMKDYIIIIIGVAVLLVCEYFEEKGESIQEKIDKKSFKIQWGAMMVSIVVLLLFGILRGDYIASEFIYKQF